MLAFVCRFGVEVAGKFNGWVNAVEIIDEKFLEKKPSFYQATHLLLVTGSYYSSGIDAVKLLPAIDAFVIVWNIATD